MCRSLSSRRFLVALRSGFGKDLRFAQVGPPRFADNGQNVCLCPPRIEDLRGTRNAKSVGLTPECHFSFRWVSFCLRSTVVGPRRPSPDIAPSGRSQRQVVGAKLWPRYATEATGRGQAVLSADGNGGLAPTGWTAFLHGAGRCFCSDRSI